MMDKEDEGVKEDACAITDVLEYFHDRFEGDAAKAMAFGLAAVSVIFHKSMSDPDPRTFVKSCGDAYVAGKLIAGFVKGEAWNDAKARETVVLSLIKESKAKGVSLETLLESVVRSAGMDPSHPSWPDFLNDIKETVVKLHRDNKL